MKRIYNCTAAMLVILAGAALFSSHLVKAGPGSARTPKSTASQEATPGQKMHLAENYGKLPLSFEANQGQVDGRVKFLSRGSGYTLFLTGDEAVLSLRKADVAPTFRSARPGIPSPSRAEDAGLKPGATTPVDKTTTDNGPQTTDSVLRMRLVGANASATVTGADERPGKSNYFIGNDPKKWRTNVANYGRVKYASVYPGVDLVYYGNQRQLEYDFVVAPGADPRVITLDVGTGLAPPSDVRNRRRVPNKSAQAPEPTKRAGQAPPLRIAADGDLVINTDGGEVRFHKPVVYQLAAHPDVAPVSSPAPWSAAARRRFMLEPARISKTTDHHQARLLDTPDREQAHQEQSGSKLPHSTQRQYVEAHYVLNGKHEISFEIAAYDHSKVLVIDPVLSYSTYLGGTGGEIGVGIAVDSSGSAYAFGWTGSANFPVITGAYQTSCKDVPNTNQCSGDAFITKFSPAGNTLVYSTFLGGSARDVTGAFPNGGIAIDSVGNAYVTGSTGSTDFPHTTGAFQTSCGSCASGLAGFVSKISADGSQLLYSTYLGGSRGDQPAAIAVDSSGNAFVGGFAGSADFPTTPSGYQTTCPFPVGSGCAAAFMAELKPSASGMASLVYSTFFGSSTTEAVANGIATDTSGHPYIAGNGGLPNDSEGYVAKFDTSQSGAASLVYAKAACSTSVEALAVDSSGNAYITGNTLGFSQYIPCSAPVNGFQTAVKGLGNAFLMELDPSGSSFLYATYLGGSNPNDSDVGWGVTVDSSGKAYVAGQTSSTDFPLQNPVVTAFAGSGSDTLATGFVTKIDPSKTGAASLVYSTYLGGTDFNNSSVWHVAVDSGENAYVIGFTQSHSFPTATPFKSVLMSTVMAFVAKIGAADAPGVAFGPGALTFGNQNVGSSSAPQTVTLTAAGSQPLTITRISFSGTNPGDFSQTNTCGTLPATLPGGTDCNLNISFKPKAPGTRTASLTVKDNAAGSPQLAQLSGTAIGVPAVKLTPTKLNFPAEPIGTISPAQNITLKNTGSGNLTITSFSVTGDFAQTNNCGGTVAPNASCTISVTSTPTTYGKRTGTLSITDNASGSPHHIALTGSGPDFTIAASPGSVTVTHGNSTSSTLTLTPIGAFNHTVTLSCSVPGGKGLSCSVPPTVTLDGTNPAMVTLMLNTSGTTPLGIYKPSAKGVFGSLNHSATVTLTVQ